MHTRASKQGLACSSEHGQGGVLGTLNPMKSQRNVAAPTLGGARSGWACVSHPVASASRIQWFGGGKKRMSSITSKGSYYLTAEEMCVSRSIKHLCLPVMHAALLLADH